MITILILLAVIGVLSYLGWVGIKENEWQAGEIERLEMLLSAEQTRRVAAEKMLEPQKPVDHVVTAQEILENKPKRLRLRKSLSELSQEQEWSHKQTEKAHLDRVRMIEAIGIQKLQPKE